MSSTQPLSGARLHCIIVGLWLCLFLSAMDTTIVTTSLIRISSGFGALDKGAWLVTSYLLTYNSFLMITAKLSDIWGLKTLLLSCAGVFLVFSMACGGAGSMSQLIIFRAFQGIGGSGLYSLTFVCIMKLIEPEKIGFYSGVISSVFAMANLLGPLFGGVISDRTTWRWIFFINGPILSIAIIILYIAMPNLNNGKTNSERIRGLDAVGGLLSVGWPIPLIFALQEAGVAHAWSSSVIIGTLTTGLVLFLIFGLYEAWVTYRTAREPIFPMHFLANPAMGMTLLSQFLIGMPFYAIFVQLPQRFQSVNHTSAERAGILLLPTSLITPVGALLAGTFSTKIPVEFILIASAAVTCIGIALLSTLPTTPHIWAGTYGYEVITGLGLGLASPPYFMLVASAVKEKELSVGTGALNMVRTLGGCVAVAICSAVHREMLNDRLSAFLSPAEIGNVAASSGYVARLPADVREKIGDVLGESYNRQFRIIVAFAGANVVVAVGLALVRKRLGIFGQLPSRERVEGSSEVEVEKGGAEDVGKKEGDIAHITEIK